MAILDQYGRPVNVGSLTKPQAAPGMTGIRQIWAGSVASGLTPQRLARILAECDQGNLDAFLTLAEEMEEREPRLHQPVAERATVQIGHEPDGQSDRPAQCDDGLDLAVGNDARGGVGAESPGLFPPLPGDFAQWRDTLDRRPDLKPSLQRLDDGLAPGMDRPAAAGNGVVPLAAACAWRALRDELTGG